MKPTPGTKLGGRYQLVEFIAQGGMGEVWKAQDLVFERVVAVKFLKFEYGESKEHLARFQSEARAMASLDHPGIARGLDAGQDQGVNYLVMEFVPGSTLSALIKNEGQHSVDRTLSLLVQISEALSAAHGQGFVHRDIKPSNILVKPDGTVKVTDFGIVSNASDTRLTVTGQVIGTAQYISPEQATGREATAASDIYALGAIVYECLAGQPPFSGSTPMAVAIAHINDTPPPLPVTIPGELRQLVMSMLAKEPTDRPPSASAVVRKAQDIRRNEILATAEDARSLLTRPLPSPSQWPHEDKTVKLSTSSGMTLSALIKNEGQLSVDRTLSLLVHISEALSAAHGQGFVHRDIKPSNILVKPGGTVKLTDLGIASNGSDTKQTVTSKVIGTLQYISPEQAMGREATAASDIYALGAIVYECLAGQPPFSGSTQVVVATAHVNYPPPPLPVTIPEELRQLVMSMLAKDPTDRPPSASAVVRKAQNIRRNKILAAKTIELTTPIMEVSKPSRAMPSCPRSPSRSLEREEGSPQRDC